ncbi:DUF1566 domain-containing protein [Chromatium okenii]|uniref:Lcl C-terminal domain-containing protein n=1 Tax=Chromatium okenii TaxID=61644 RepID=UPI0026F087C7|nr:DUF1566 domain-containing protein [Chromatium okenii]MBV5310172.1 DUF1566 domain-containing protein [Chromatium okenii]
MKSNLISRFLMIAAVGIGIGFHSSAWSIEPRPSLSGLQTQINALTSGKTPVAPLVGESTAACDSTTQGLLRWNATVGQLELCDGTAWAAVLDQGHAAITDMFAVIRNLVKNDTVNRYLVKGTNDEIIKDFVTGLEWQRCSVGQSWDKTNKTCTGTASSFNWDTSITLTVTGGFRIPTIDELKTLVYCSSKDPITIGMTADLTRCSGTFNKPTIVAWAFPNTPSSWFWSGSPIAYGSYYAWSVSFGNGYADHNSRDDHYHVRLVRSGQ